MEIWLFGFGRQLSFLSFCSFPNCDIMLAVVTATSTGRFTGVKKKLGHLGNRVFKDACKKCVTNILFQLLYV